MNTHPSIHTGYPLRLHLVLFVLMLSCFVTFPVNSEPPRNYKSGKRIAEMLWWDIGPLSFYCTCPYRVATPEEKNIRNGNLWVIGFACGYTAKSTTTKNWKVNDRVLRIEFEHVVPAEMLKSRFSCANIGRSDCRKSSTAFNLAEGDLHNLVPVIGELNGHRGSKEYGVIPNEDREYGACDFEVTESKAEPTEAIRGDLARITLYMNDRYDLHLSNSYIQLMKDWHTNDPVDKIERTRHDILAKKMGWDNPYVVKK